MAETPRTLPPQVQAVIEDFLPICHKLAGDQRYAISIGGSLGKGTWDQRSDVDFRLFLDHAPLWPHEKPELWADYFAGLERWKEKGILIDGVWVRTVGEIDAALDGWLDGKIQPVPLLWTIWGYYVLPDIYHQWTIEDPYNIIGGWKQRLGVYPPKLKAAILQKYVESMQYWRGDYHYQNKVERGDVVFLAGMSSKLVHEMLQVIFALNETYFVGDGSNLAFVEKFKILPANFSARVQAILYPGGPGAVRDQYAGLCSLIDEVVALAAQLAG
jgi:hypothetical protein